MADETALMLDDLYRSLCVDPQETDSVQYQRRLQKLYRFFTAFIACWTEDESCPRIPAELQNVGVCDYIKLSLDWLSTQGQPQISRMFKRLVAQNIDENAAMLNSYGVSEYDILEINNLVAREDSTAFYNKMREITQKLVNDDRTARRNMTLLGVMGSLIVAKVPSSNQQSVELTAGEKNNLLAEDILFKTDRGFTVLNPVRRDAYYDSDGFPLETPVPIQGVVNLYQGEFVVCRDSRYYKMQSGLIKELTFVQISESGKVQIGLIELQMKPNPNVIAFLLETEFVQIDLSNGDMMIFPKEAEAFTSKVRDVYKLTKVVTDGILSVCVFDEDTGENTLYAVPLIVLDNKQPEDKTDAYLDKLNAVENAVRLDLQSATNL